MKGRKERYHNLHLIGEKQTAIKQNNKPLSPLLLLALGSEPTKRKEWTQTKI